MKTCPACGKEIVKKQRKYCNKKCSIPFAKKAWKNRITGTYKEQFKEKFKEKMV